MTTYGGGVRGRGEGAGGVTGLPWLAFEASTVESRALTSQVIAHSGESYARARQLVAARRDQQR